MAKSFLVTRSEMQSKFCIDAPQQGASVDAVRLGRKVRVEWTDYHRPSGARLYRMTWTEADAGVKDLDPPCCSYHDGRKCADVSLANRCAICPLIPTGSASNAGVERGDRG